MRRSSIVIEASEHPNTSLAILFGWAGCKDRYLSKYSEVYKKAGFTVVRYTSDVRKIRSYRSFEKFAYRVYEECLHDKVFSMILCHVFSMNGASMFCGLWEMLGKVEDGKAIKSMIKGVIFDSSPALITPWQMAVAVSLALVPPTTLGIVLRCVYRVCLSSILVLFNARVWLKSCWQNNAWEKNHGYFHLCATPDLPKKQLFIYSKCDNICLWKSIEKFTVKQEMQGVHVTKLLFQDSPHCEHFRFHKDEYIASCAEFLHSLYNANV